VRGPRHDTTLPEAERKPACVLACPTNARLFGDVHDPDSEVSVAIRERGGYALMPEWGTQPANHYLPRRKTAAHPRRRAGARRQPAAVDGHRAAARRRAPRRSRT
jgi:Fe-S-cluster-containing dehydrogenase component